MLGKVLLDDFGVSVDAWIVVKVVFSMVGPSTVTVDTGCVTCDVKVIVAGISVFALIVSSHAQTAHKCVRQLSERAQSAQRTRSTRDLVFFAIQYLAVSSYADHGGRQCLIPHSPLVHAERQGK